MSRFKQRRTGLFAQPALPVEAFDTHPFREECVALAPQATGVYVLYRRGRVLRVGIAVHGTSIRLELERHLSGLYGESTRTATAFSYEVTRDPVLARADYLRGYGASASRRPRSTSIPASSARPATK